MGTLLVSLKHIICSFWSPIRVSHTWKDRKPINVSLWVVSNKIHCIPVADPLFLDQNEAQRAEKKIFEAPPLISGSGWPAPSLSEGLDLPLYPYKKENAVGWDGSPLKPEPCPDWFPLGGLILIFQQVPPSFLYGTEPSGVRKGGGG